MSVTGLNYKVNTYSIEVWI